MQRASCGACCGRFSQMIDFSNIAKPNLVYKGLYNYVSVALRLIYFRKFRVVGRENIPHDRSEGFLLICNHQNGLLDALSVIFAVAPREPIFLARGDIFKKDKLAVVLRTLRILPAFRKRDVGVENLDQNDAIFAQAEKLIADGAVIAIFPEAGHQTHHYLGTFKKGFARIAFGYEECCDFSRNLKILPLGHHYSGYRGMRNDVLYTIGEPFTFEDLYDVYREHPERGRYLLNQRARDSVERLMLNVDDPDNYEAIELLCDMYIPVWRAKNGRKVASLKSDLEARRALNALLRDARYGKMPSCEEQESGAMAASGIAEVACAAAPTEGSVAVEAAKSSASVPGAVDPTKVAAAAKLIAKGEKYRRNLDKLRLDDSIVGRGGALGFAGRTLLWIVLLPLFALSAAVNFLPHKLSVAISRKIKDKMLVPSLQFGVGLPVFFFWYLILFAVIWIVCGKFWIALCALLAMPATMLAYHNLRVLSSRLCARLRKWRLKVRRDPLYSETEALRREILDTLKAC